MSSRFVSCYIQIIDVEVLLHSTATGRPRTLRIIETTYYSYSYVFASLRRLVSSSDRENVIILNLDPQKEHKEIQDEIVENITKRDPKKNRLRQKETPFSFSPSAK